MAEDIERLVLRLEANTRQFENNLKKARGESTKQLRAIEQRTQKMARRVQTLMAGTFTGALLAQFGRSTLKLAGDFEASMNRVQAALGATDVEMKSLNGKARELGKTTAFAASEAADAIEVLAKNGLNADQILGGAVDASLALAGALGGDLAASADLATDLMAQFKLQASDLPGIVDQVTGAALKSKFGFDDLRLAIGQAGGVVGSAGVKIEDFITAIAAISPNFTSGSSAGDAFKNMMLRLVPATKDAETAMQRLGLEFFDAAGNTKPLEEIAGELQKALSGLSDEARNEVLKKIFGTEGMPAAVALMDRGAEGIRNLKSAIGDVSAEQQAEARMQGLNGALRELNSAWEDLLLTAANGGALDASTAAVARLTDAVRFLSENFDEVLPWIERVAVALTAVLVARGLDYATASIVSTGLALVDFAKRMGKAQSGAVTLGAALTGLRGGPLLALAAIAGVAFLEFRRGARDGAAALDELESAIDDTNTASKRLEEVNRDLEKSKDDLKAASDRYLKAVELEGPAVQASAAMEIEAINARIAGREAEAQAIAANLKLKEQELRIAARNAREALVGPIRREIIGGGELRRRSRTGRTRVEDPTESEVDAALIAKAKEVQARIFAGEASPRDAEFNRNYGGYLIAQRQADETLEASENARSGKFQTVEYKPGSAPVSSPPSTSVASPPVVTKAGEVPPEIELTPLQKLFETLAREARSERQQNDLIGKDGAERAGIETDARIRNALQDSGITREDLNSAGFADTDDFVSQYVEAAKAVAQERIQLQESERLAAETRKALAEEKKVSAEEAATATVANSDPGADAKARIDRDIVLEEAKIARLREIRDRSIGTLPDGALPVPSAIERDQRSAARRTALDDAGANAPEGLEAEARKRESLRLDANDLERGIRDIASAQEDLARTEQEAAQARKREDARVREESDKRQGKLDEERTAGRAALDEYIAGAVAKQAVSERLQAALENGTAAYETEKLAIEAETEAERQLVAAKEAGVTITKELADASLASAQARIAAEQELQKAVEERRTADKRKQDETKKETDETARQQKEIEDAVKQAGDSIGRTFEDIITGSASAEDAVKSLILELGKMALQKAVIGPVGEAASGIFGNVLTGIMGSVVGGIGGAVGGGAAGTIGPGGTAKFAKGGVVGGPTNFGFDGGRRLGLMGEAGPEAIMPLKRGPDGKLGVAGGAGGGTTVTVNIATRDAESFRRSSAQVSATLARAVARGQRNM